MFDPSPAASGVCRNGSCDWNLDVLVGGVLKLRPVPALPVLWTASGAVEVVSLEKHIKRRHMERERKVVF